MNPLLQNRQNPTGLIQQFNQFRKQMAGQDPRQVLNQMLQSGQVTQEQINDAAVKAKSLAGILKLK